MKKFLSKLFLVAFVLTFAISCNESLVPDVTRAELDLKSASNAKKSYIVVVDDVELDNELSKLKGYEKKQAVVKSASSKILKRAGILDGEVEHVYGTALKGFSVKLAAGQLKQLKNDPAVKYIEEDQIITLIQPDIKVKKRPTPPAPAETVPWGIIRVNGGQDGTGKTAWVIDSGIDLDHPDLNVDAARSRTYVLSASADDDHGHGSHVAGTIAAKDNDIGVIGVAAGATLVAVKVLDRTGSGSTTGVIAGVDYVAENAAPEDVANMSLGGGVSPTLDAAVLAASSACKFILAAGNESDNAENHSPARVDGTNIFSISAMDSNDEFAYFSNYGAAVDYCDPGVNIYSTYKGGAYATMSGTSMAAPHAAGVLLLGNETTDGNVIGDPDEDDDPILVNRGGDSNENTAPTADAGTNQTITVGELVTLDGSMSTDDKEITSYIWTEDGNQIASGVKPEVLLSVGEHIITLTVSDAEGLTGTDTVTITIEEQTTPGNILLSTSGYKVRGVRFVELTWSGNTTNVDIYRDGSKIASDFTGTSYTDELGKVSGTFTYQVCETGGGECSNKSIVSL